jgi:sterol desaturase/sphingolipid hydroxylase (fatty acid hydroxylase superfamily)
METTLYRGPFLLIVLGLMLLEAGYILWVRKGRYDPGHSVTSVGVAVGNALSRPVTHGVILLIFPIIAKYAPWSLPADQAWVWVLGFAGVEFTYYWMHRLSHTVRWFWASHSVHHSSPEFTLPAAVRLGWTTALSGEWLLFLPLILLGFPPVMVTVLLALNLVYQFFLHTELSPRWGLLESVLNTPAHHRIHHASNTAYLDKNFGGVLIVFDRLFGTFAADDGHEPVRFGLRHGKVSHNPFVVAFGEWGAMFKDVSRARSLKAVWRAVAGKPG